MLCLLKDSDPLQRREIRLMAQVKGGGKCYLYISALQQEQRDTKDGENPRKRRREEKKEDKVTF